MLIRFRVENYLSFKDEIEFSLINGLSKNHPEHIVNKKNVGILRGAAIYGPNASGKSNLIKAITFARGLVLDKVNCENYIPIKPFKMDITYSNKPSKFEFEFFADGKIYLFGFEVNHQMIISEWLSEIKKSGYVAIYERETTEDKHVSVILGKLPPNSKKTFLEEFAKGTRYNQLFLSKCYDDANIVVFDQIAEWFRKLEVVFPSSKYQGFPIEATKESSSIIEKIIDTLKIFGTGIESHTVISFDPRGTIDDDTINKIQMEKSKFAVLFDSENQFYIAKYDEDKDELNWSQVAFLHEMDSGDGTSDCYFELSEESDGTLRLIDLIPILFSENKTYFVDEIERSIHPSLIYKFIELFFQNNRNSQIIFTTHEDHLLSQDLLRRDEIWFIEKNKGGVSQVYSLEEYAPRADLNLQKGYLMGRFGAIPLLGNINFEEWKSKESEE